MGAYHRWATTDDVLLTLNLVSPSQTGATGLTPEVAIRRVRESQGGAALDGYYWDGAIFTSTPTWLAMSEFDAANNPGLYQYLFDNSGIGAEHVYQVYFRHTVTPIGFDTELHTITDELYIPVSSPVAPVLPGDTVMGRLADMEDPLGPVNQATADAVWDESLAGHLTPGSTGEALSRCAAVGTGSSQIDFTIEDTGSNPIQGAQVDIYDAANTIFLTRLFTDINGQVSLAIDDGSYNVRLFASGYSFTVPEPLLVAGDGAVTFVGTNLITITPPSAPDLCVIFGTIRDAAGQVVAGACVEAFADTPQVVSGTQYGERIAQTTTDVNGYFELELVRLTQVRFSIDGTGLDIERTVPDAVSQDITTWT